MKLVVASLGLMLATVVPATAQDIESSPDLAPDIAALPRLVGESAAVQRINDQLALLDQRDFETVSCGDPGRAQDPVRTIEILADGPDFLSVMITSGGYCEGAAHPWWTQSIANFDLKTGEATDLRQYFPQAWQGSDETLFLLFINTVGELSGECLQAYTALSRDEFYSFDLGLAETEAALVILPVGLPYIDSPCVMTAYVPATRLAEAGFGSRLVQALSPPT
jgi:hypothetical protein